MITATFFGHQYTIDPLPDGGYMVQNDKPCIVALQNTLEAAIEWAHIDAVTIEVGKRITHNNNRLKQL